MQLTKNQLIIAGVTGLVVVVLGLILAGVIPGLRTSGPEAIAANLTMWGVGDNAEAFAPAIAEFKTKYRNVELTYRAFPSEAVYEPALLDALAAGAGPDIFALRNDKLFRHLNKIAPLPTTRMNVAELRARFPQAVEQDFYSNGQVYALPLSIDTLALFYNRDLLDAAGVPTPPKTWDEVQSLVPSLTKKDGAGKITQAAIALGGRAEEIESAVDALYLLMLQTGTKMADDAFTRAAFDSSEGLNALRFYLQFGNPASASYTWNSSLGNLPTGQAGARARFADEKSVMLVDYASAIPSLTAQNAFLNFGIAPIPQPKDAVKELTYPMYYGYAVSRRSRYPALAAEFVKAMTTSDTIARGYADATKKPPALRALVTAFGNDPVRGVFARQILTARSWPQVDPEGIRAVFARLIASSLENPAGASDALRSAAQEITTLMERRGF